ncbi:MAG TPA: hypothetical protein PLN13_02075 [Bacteroidia bacterium]|nr:hypothetical protein [Bacteroidia bacterium]HRH07342.1 hypothetical protein [Bacteroidia bacterium]
MTDKEKFVRNGFLALLTNLNPKAKGQWGVMNGQEMVEHMSYAFRQANGKDTYELVTPAENVERMQQFVMSDKEFKPNTKNSLLGEVAIPAQKNSMHDSIQELKEEIDAFFAYFKNDKELVLMNPFFGALNYEKWIALLYKHCVHHAKQFDLLK